MDTSKTSRLVTKICNAITLANESAMIIGMAGCGKSYLIRMLAKELELKGKNVAVTAATGVAAVNIQGSTFHSWGGVGLARGTAESIYRNIEGNPRYRKRWLGVDIIIIDEISMIGTRFFDKMSEVAKLTRDSEEVWGGIQLILVGDLLQLPPVKDKWIFTSQEFKELLENLVLVSLTKPKRYPDNDWFELLSRIRLGNPNEDDIKKLKARMRAYDQNWLRFKKEQEEYKRRLTEDARAEIDWSVMPTILYSKKRDVERENYEHLESLPTEKKVFTATDRILKGGGYVADYVKVLEDVAPLVVNIKIGAQVMLTWNLDVSGGLCNGSRGVVTGYIGDGVEVKFLRRTEVILKVERTYKTPDGKLLARIQMPLIVAYSTTIHKSQGATLDYIVVDIGTSVFLPGQAYVALSRCRTLEGTFICAFSEKSIRNVDTKSLQFLRDLGVEE